MLPGSRIISAGARIGANTGRSHSSQRTSVELSIDASRGNTVRSQFVKLQAHSKCPRVCVSLLHTSNSSSALTTRITETIQSLEELLRLRLNEASPQTPSDELQKEVPIALPNDHSSVSIIQRLEQKLRAETQKREIVESKCTSLERERESSTRQSDGADNLRIKVSQMVERLRHEREQRSKVEKILANEKRKLSVLSDHIEKLMIHLRHEALAKSRSLKVQSKQQREIDMLTENILSANKKNDRKDELISDLRNSSQLLEAQLKLMVKLFLTSILFVL